MRIARARFVVQHFHIVSYSNFPHSAKVTATILEELHELVERGEILTSAEGGMQYSLVTRHWSEEDREKLAFVLPKYFGKKEE